jgi:3-oxosteroid 1-dehydrogenase
MENGSSSSNGSFDHTVDVVVVGSGAGGIAAAWGAATEGLSVVVIEKAELYGGNSALSGGGAWIPNAPEFIRQGQRDDPAQLLAYLRTIAPDVDPARHKRYLDEAPRFAAALEATPFFANNGFFWARGYSDYHPDKGGNPLGRGLWASPIDRRHLGEDGEALRGGRSRIPGAPRGMWLTSSDFRDLTFLRWKSWRGKRALARLAMRTIEARLRGQDMMTSGAALVTRLRLVLKATGVPVWLQTPMQELIRDDSGAVIGVLAERQGQPVRIRARGGVVIATGGFEHSAEMRAKYQPTLGGRGWSSGSPDNTGDGIRAGEAVGGALDLMDDAWWMPAMQVPGGVFPLVAERAYPEQFIVNGAGVRFINEAAPYTDFGHAVLEGQKAGVSHIPVFLITDHHGWTHNIIAGHLPGKPMPKEWVSSGLVSKAGSLDELASEIGVPGDALVATAERYNQLARSGHDDDFQRGDSAYDQYYGNPDYPNPNLGEVAEPPFYAFRLVPGDLGTKGGLLTDENGRVLRDDGSVIPGLYATGNASASVMGHDYAGPGATIGPAMTFGWVAGRDIAERTRSGSRPNLVTAATD